MSEKQPALGLAAVFLLFFLQQLVQRFGRGLHRHVVVGPGQLFARGQAAEFGGQRAEHAVGGFAGEDAVKHAPGQLLAQGVRRALSLNRVGHGGREDQKKKP